MGTLSEHCYAFPLIGGILAIIALFTPAAYYAYPLTDMGYGMLVWMWGFVMRRNLGVSRIYFFNAVLGEEPDIFGTEFFGFLTSIVSTSAIAIAAFILIITAQRVKHGKMSDDKASIIWALMALIIIGACIFWIITVEYYYGVYTGSLKKGYPKIVKYIFEGAETDQFSFWAFFNPSIGIILPFIAATIALIGVYVK